MMKLLALTSFVFLCSVVNVSAQDRKAVGAAEVNGTFRFNFSSKYREFSNEIKILALGKGKLKVAFDLVYPHTDASGEMMPNLGQTEGTAEISGDTAVFKNPDDETCKITITFVKPGQINVSQESDCGFGHNVTADGTYKKVSGAKPKFDANQN